jgi:AAA domain
MSHPLPVSITQVSLEALAWLWPRYIPKGKLTVLDGDPSLGKSLTTLDLAARLSRGVPMPDGSGGGEIGRTLIIQVEDGNASTVRPRLLAAGADLEQVFVFPDTSARILRLPWNTPWLERAIRDSQAALVIIDPLMAFLSRRIWAASDQMIRRVLGKLAEVAERTGAAIVLVRHLNKNEGQKALYRGGGSIGIVGVARSALLAVAHPSGDGRNLLTATKANLGPTPPALAYRIVGNDSGIATIAWEGPIDLTADEALNPPPTKDDKPSMSTILATEWLMAALKDGPRPASEIARAAEAAGISERTLDRAKKPAHVISTLDVNRKTNERRWIWKMNRDYFEPLEELPRAPDVFW